jgi:hypothetical protein
MRLSTNACALALLLNTVLSMLRTDDSRNVTNGGYLTETTSDLDRVLVIDCVKVAAYQLPFVAGYLGVWNVREDARHGTMGERKLSLNGKKRNCRDQQ